MQELIVLFLPPLSLEQQLVLEGVDSFEKRLQVYRAATMLISFSGQGVAFFSHINYI